MSSCVCMRVREWTCLYLCCWLYTFVRLHCFFSCWCVRSASVAAVTSFVGRSVGRCLHAVLPVQGNNVVVILYYAVALELNHIYLNSNNNADGDQKTSLSLKSELIGCTLYRAEQSRKIHTHTNVYTYEPIHMKSDITHTSQLIERTREKN